MGTEAGFPDKDIRGLLQFMRVIILHADNKTIEEISEATGIRPEYVEGILRIITGMGIAVESGNRFYIEDDMRDSYNSSIMRLLNATE